MFVYFFFNDTATTEIYTLSLHDALPISVRVRSCAVPPDRRVVLRHSWQHSSIAVRWPSMGLPRSHVPGRPHQDRKSTRLNSSHANISYAVFCLKKKKKSLATDHVQ